MCHQIKDTRMKIPPISSLSYVRESYHFHSYNTLIVWKRSNKWTKTIKERDSKKGVYTSLLFFTLSEILFLPLISRIRLPWSEYASFASRNIDFRFSTVAWLRLTFQFLRGGRPAAPSIECAWIIDHAPTRKREKGARKAFRRSNSREAAKYRTRSSIPRHRFHFVPSVQRPFHPLARD